MKIDKYLTDAQLLAEIGGRLSRLRLQRNLTQQEVARQAGVAVSTVQRLERGEVATQLSAFLRVCRVLDLLDHLDALLPDDRPGPVELLQMRGKPRRRASGSRKPPMVAEPWTWGDGA